MLLRCRVSCFFAFFAALLMSAYFVSSSVAQQAAAAGKALTVERIYSQPSLSGRLTRGLAWTPDGKQLSYFETIGSGKEAKTELWGMDAASGERRLLVASDKLESILPPETSRPTQATGLGRRAPSQYQWAPDGAGILFQGSTALAWLDVKSQMPRTLVSGKAAIADPQNFA
jgi:dipeptidyl-peptidase-4